MIKVGPYRACLLDLVCDPKSRTLSATKIWMNISYGIMSELMLTNPHIGWKEMLVYSAVVGSSHVAIYWLNRKYENADNSNSNVP